MYRIALYEEGVFRTFIGGPLHTLTETIEQAEKIIQALQAEPVVGYFGYKFDRAGTICALIVTDSFGFPIQEAKEA